MSAPGLTGQYFGDKDLTNLKLTRTDLGVNATWGLGSPDPTLSVDGFSARWTGRVLPKFTENYSFSVQADDGMRLWVNGQLLVDNWTDHAVTESFGQHFPDWREVGRSQAQVLRETPGSAAVKLLWASPSQGKEVIPATQLSSRKENLVNNWCE